MISSIYITVMDAELSKDEALYFLEKVLGIESPETKLMENKLDFLNLLVRRYIERLPFQNLTLLARARHSTHGVPLWPEIKEDMMAGYGGMCCTLGVFMNTLLKTLGYSVQYAPCNIIGSRHDHIYTLVRNLSYEGSEHMVDIVGFPNFEIVPLDFESESPRYKFSFCPYYLKRIDGKGIERHNIKGSDAEDQVFATYYQEPEELENFIPTMRRLYTSKDYGHFLREFHMVSFNGGKCVSIRGSALLQEDDNHTLQKTLIDDSMMAQVIQKNFPQYSIEVITDAVEYLKHQ